MGVYIIKRLALMIPTLFGIMLINFIIIQSAPGGPVDQMLAKMAGEEMSATQGMRGSSGAIGSGGRSDSMSGGFDSARGIDPSYIKELEKQFGFDKPAHERFFIMIRDYLSFEFGQSFYQDVPVVDLVKQRLPVSISLGLWTLLFVYMISIPLGIAKAVRDGTPFDIWTSAVVFAGYAVPAFIIAVLLIVFFAGGEFLNIFPLRGLFSDNFRDMSTVEKILDYLWHITLPVIAMLLGAFATLTLLTKNTFLEEINKQFVLTARAKGLTERRVLYGHVFRNAMLIVVAGFPAAFVSVLFTGALLIEVVFSLNGLGLLGYEAALTRDYPVLFGTLFVFTLIGLVMHLVGDIMYMLIDPRIDFETREV